MGVEFEGNNYSRLAEFLNQNMGAVVEFNNGCSVYLKVDVGMLWRTDPYGQDGGCNFKDGWEDNIREWLRYWDEPRTETGALVSE